MFKSNNIFLLLFVVALMAGETSAAKVDPTRPFGHKASSTATPSSKKMVLESIIHGDGIQTVVISGKVLKAFDYIGEYQLTTVNEQSVILRSETQRLKLNIFKDSVVKTSVAK